MTSFFGHPITIWDMVSSFAYLVICVVGLFGNLLAIYVIVRYTRMKTVTNQYILNLSISDAIFLLDLPLIIVGGLLKRWIFGVVMCKVYFATTGINMFTGSFTLAVLSGDRYLAVCHPGKAVVYRTARNARIVILLTWLVSVLLLAPIIIYANIYPQFPQNVTNDSYNSSSSSLQVSSSTLDSLNNERPQHLVKRRNLEASTDFQVRQFFFGKLLLHSSGELKSREDGLRLRKERLMADVIDRIKAALEERGRLVKRNSSKMFPSNFRTDNKMKRQVTLEDEIFDPSTTVPPVEEVQMTYTCTVDWPSKDYVIPAVHAYIIYNMVIGFVIPVMVISILYTTLVVKLSKDPEGGGSSGEGSENKNHSFGKTIKKTFLSKEYSFGKRSESFKMKKSSSSPKTPTIHEDQVLAYKTPPEIMRKIGHRILSEGNVKDDSAPTRCDAGKISTISRQVTAQSDSVVLGKPPPVIRNISAFKQRRMQQPRITRLVTSIILVYVVCWLPYWAFQLHLITNMTAVRDSRWKLTLYHIFTFLSYCNSAINPILYVFTNQNFRDSFVVAVQCKEDVGSKARRTVGQFKDGVRMTDRSVRPTPPPPATLATGVQHLWSSKSNGETKIALKRFHSCSPNLSSRKDGGLNNNNSNKEQMKPLVGMEINHHDNALVNNSGNRKPNEIADDHKNDADDVTRPPFDPSIETKILKEA